MESKFLFAAVFAVAFFILSSVSIAAISNLITVQGKLTNQNSGLQNGTFPMVFKLYTAETGGSAIYTEQLNVNATNGIFEAYLGSNTSLAGIPFDQQYYMGIQVSTDSEMTPRIRVGSSGYSFRSNITDYLNYTTIAEGRLNFSSTGNITFGGDTQIYRESAGDIVISGGAGALLRLIPKSIPTYNSAIINMNRDSTGSTNRFRFGIGDNVFSTGTAGTAILSESNSGIKFPILFMVDTTEVMRIGNNSNVGIGTASPLSKLHVSGNVNITTDTGPTLYLVSTSQNPTLWFTDPTSTMKMRLVGGDLRILDTNDANLVHFDSGGTVGIGTSTIASGTKLNISGGALDMNNNNINNVQTITGDSATNLNIQHTTNSILIGVDASNTARNIHLQTDNAAGALIDRIKIGSYANIVDIDITNANFDIDNGKFYYQNSSGNVGIGTTTPQTTLDVVGGRLYVNRSSNRIVVNPDNAESHSYATIGTETNIPLTFLVNNLEALYLQNSTGNVGINTTSPTTTLDIRGNFNVTRGSAINATADSGTTLRLGSMSTSGAALQLISPDNDNINPTSQIFGVTDPAISLYRFAIQKDGGLIWGNGSLDTNLYRSTANVLKTDDSLIVGGSWLNATNVELGAGVISFQGGEGVSGALVFQTGGGQLVLDAGNYVAAGGGNAGKLTLRTAAVDRLLINGTGAQGTGFLRSYEPLWFGSDTASVANITFGATGDTNLYRASASTLKTDDTLQVALNLVVDTGNAGVGITWGSAEDTNLYRGAADVLKTDDNMNIIGNLSLGGTTRTRMLDLNFGSIQLKGENGIFWWNSPNNDNSAMGYINFTGGSAGGRILFGTNAGEKMRIDESGYVGIGTTSPTTTLHVGAGTDSATVTANAIITAAGTTNLAIRDSTNNVELMNYVDSTTGLIGTSTNHPLTIRTNNANVMTLLTNGNVGIGTTSPNSSLTMGNVNDGTLSYLQIDSTNGVPGATDCDEDLERGRMLVDYLNNNLLICNGATRGWDTVALTN